MPYYWGTPKKAAGGPLTTWTGAEVDKALSYLEKQKDKIAIGEQLQFVKGTRFWEGLCLDDSWNRSAGATATWMRAYLKKGSPNQTFKILTKGKIA